MTASLVCDALKMAWFRGKRPGGAIVHTDRGSRYCSNDFQALLRQYGMRSSMSREGDWLHEPLSSSKQSEYRSAGVRHSTGRSLRFNFFARKSTVMTIWVDADACPVVIRDILFRAAERTVTPLVLVANSHIKTPPSKVISALQVPKGFDVADNEIARRVQAGDLVITGDIPLAADAIDKGALALSARGELHTKENIRGRLNIRDFIDTMRASGIPSGGPPPMSQADRQAFANALDRYLQQQPGRRGTNSR